MDFFDANFCVGLSARKQFNPAVTADDALAVMDKAGVKDALVWHVAQLDSAAQAGNRLAAELVAASDRLWACWAILPPQTEEVLRPGFFEEMRANKVVALRAFPVQHCFLLNRTVFGAFFDETAERKIPLLISVEPTGVDWATIYGLMKDYPKLTCVLCDTGGWNRDRFFWPLLEAYPNVYVETSCLSLEAGGLDATVRKYGADRIVFGSSFPRTYVEAAMLDTLHADVSESDREKIASGNLRRIVREVRL